MCRIKFSKPPESGYQFLVIHSGRPYAFTTLEVLQSYPSKYQSSAENVYDSSAIDNRRSRRYEGVLISRYDQSFGTGVGARIGPALHNENNPDRLQDVFWGRDDYSVIQHRETREVGSGVSVQVKKQSDGNYEVTVSGGKKAEFKRWCFPIWFSDPDREYLYDNGCLLNEPKENF